VSGDGLHVEDEGGSDEPVDAPVPGRGLIQASWTGTLAYSVVAALATAWPAVFEVPVALVSLALFFGGVGAFLWAYAVAVSRSRTDQIGVGGLFFLAGCAPRSVQRSMMASLALQVVVAVVTASIRLYTPLAFGVLVPVWGLGLAGLWGARHGTFPPRPAAEAAAS
jgi:hypothetical protein